MTTTPTSTVSAIPQYRPAIRRAANRDFTEIRRLLVAAYGQYEALMPPPVYRAYLDDLLDLGRHDEHGMLYVATDHDRILGSAAFYPRSSVQGMGFPDGWSGGRALAVHPQARSRGVAASLLAWCEKLAGYVGSPVFAFHTAAFMTAATDLYERLGYQRLPRYDFDLARHLGLDDQQPAPAIAFGRSLTRASTR
jgi:GNAT superfamily N-acetyltransferase